MPVSFQFRDKHVSETDSTKTMTTRRTRSGAPLGCNAEPRRHRQTPAKKQQAVKGAEEEGRFLQAGDTTVKEKSEPALEKSDKENIPSAIMTPLCESPKKLPVQNANIWERLEKDKCDLFCEDQLKDSSGRQTTAVSVTYLKAGSSSPEQSTSAVEAVASRKTRKPEILVSLLESEASYPASHLKCTVGPKLNLDRKAEEGTDNLKYSRENQFTSLGAKNSMANYKEGCTTAYCYPSTHLCFFPHCEHHRTDTSTDFLHMPDVPGEPFFVSLSKDKNKELNMVKTSSGTVRVGCGLRRFVHPGLTFTDPYKRYAVPVPGKAKSNSSQESSSMESAPADAVCPAEPLVSKGRVDKTECKHGCSVKTVDQQADCSCGKWRSTKHLDLSMGYNTTALEDGIPDDAWDVESSIDKTPDSDSFPPLSDTEFEHSSQADASVSQRPGYAADGFGGSATSKTSVPSTIFQYPLMKEILTEQSYTTFTSVTPNTVCFHEPPELLSETALQPKKTISLLKPSSAALTSLPSLLAVENEYETKSVVKRSERIRCKSGVGVLPTVPHHQAVISTMKSTTEKKNKSKSKSHSSKKKCKASTGRDTQKKKVKKGKGEVRKMPLIKKSKDFSKAKATMSREVMDGIVQSIEETVSRGREEEEEQEEAPSDSTSYDTRLSTRTADYSSYPDSTPGFYETSDASSSVGDRWADSSVTQASDNDDSMSSISLSLNNMNSIDLSPSDSSYATPSSTSGGAKSSKTPKSKKLVLKSKKSKKSSYPGTSGKSKSLKIKVGKAKVKPFAITTTIDATPTPITTPSISSDGTASPDHASSTVSGLAGVAAMAGKRFRKKTRKAEEAFGDYDVFCDEEFPVKKAKTKKRSSSSSSSGNNSSTTSNNTLSDPTSLNGQRRPRRSSQMGGLMTDPVLEEHAFILWASENRSQLEQQHPGASTCQVDAILSSRWCDVTDSVKARFFFRAREAFSDDDRHMIRSSAMADLESGALGDFFTDRDPVFTEFISLSTDRQRDLLRKWLKFFQKMLPKKEYIDFIVTFKRACGRDSHSPSGRPKKTRMRCLDPSYYKMLFDMIRLSKPRVLEVYRERKGKEKKMVSDTYSLLLHKLVNNEPWPHMVAGYRSQALTEILQDLGLPDSVDNFVNTHHNGTVTAAYMSAASLGNARGVAFLPTADYENDDDSIRSDDEAMEALGSGSKVKSVAVVAKPLTIPDCKPDQCNNDISLDEADYSVLNTDLALSLLAGLDEMSELPLLDQAALDQIFLAPPRFSVTPNQQRRAISIYSRRLDTSLQYPVLSSSSCQPRLLPNEAVTYSKMNVHFPPVTMPTSSGMVVHHVPTSSSPNSTLLPHKYIPRDTRGLTPVRTFCCRKDSSMDMHTYSITMENMLQGSAGHFDGTPNKCIKVHSKNVTNQTKLNLQPLSISARTHPATKLHPRIVPVSCNIQQRFSSQMFPPTSPTLLDKLGTQHVYHMGSTLPTSVAPSTPSRVYPHSLGLTSPSPLITSLSPLRNVKYTQSSKLYNNSHCQMVPYKPRMQLAGGASSHGHRRTAHTIPISTTLKSSTGRGQGSLQQIKVCLPTQALKIPIAKLRGSRKASYIRGKVKNINLQANALDSLAMSCSQPYPYNMRPNSSTSMLTKVLSYQANEADHSSKTCINDSVFSSALSNTKPTSTTFIGTMRPISVQPLSSPGHRSTAQLQLVTMVSTAAQPSDIRTTLSTQTAVVVSPLTFRRSSHLNQSTCPSSCIPTVTSLSNCGLNTHTYSITLSANGTPKHQFRNSNLSGKSLHHLASSKAVSVTPVTSIECDSTDFPELVLRDSAEVANPPAEFIVVGTCTTNPSETGKNNVPDRNEGEDLVNSSDDLPVVPVSDAVENVSDFSKATDDIGRAENRQLIISSTPSGFFHRSKDKGVPEETTSKVGRQNNSQSIPTEDPNTVDNLLQVRSMSQIKTVNAHPPGGAAKSPSPCGASPPDLSETIKSKRSTTASTTSYCLSDLLIKDASYISSDSSWQCRCPSCMTNRDKASKSKHFGESLLVSKSDIKNNLVLNGHGIKTHDDRIDCNVQPSKALMCTHYVYETEQTAAPPVEMSASQYSVKLVTSLSSVYPDATSKGNTATAVSQETMVVKEKVPIEDGSNFLTPDKTIHMTCSTDLKVPPNNNDVVMEGHDRHQNSLTQADVESKGLQTRSLSGAPGQQKLAEVAVSTRSLLASRRPIRPMTQIKSLTEEIISKPLDGSAVVPDSAPSVKKMTMCSVTVQPDTGCILVESLSSRDKSSTQGRRTVATTCDPFTASTVSASTAALPIPANVIVSQMSTATVPSSAGQPLLSQRPSRKTCSSSFNSVTVTLSNASQAQPPVTAQSPSEHLKRAH